MYITDFYTGGLSRGRSLRSDMVKQMLPYPKTLHQLFEWIDGPCQRLWQPYNLLLDNCQHFSSELELFLTGPDIGLPNWEGCQSGSTPQLSPRLLPSPRFV